MTEWQWRERLCEIGRRVWQRGFVAANDGNFSQRIAPGRILATPTMLSKGFMRPEDLAVIDEEGRQIAGERRVTSEIKLHLEIYRHRPEAQAVVHVHPPHATAFAVVQQPVPKCVLSEVELFAGEIPIVPYATPGSEELSEAARPYMRDYQALILANHGAVTIGRDIDDAYFLMETLEQYCRVLTIARQIGPVRQIEEARVGELLKIKQRLGIPDRRLRDGGNSGEAGVPSAECSTPSPAPLPPAPRPYAPAALAAPASTSDEGEIRAITDAVLSALRARGIH